MKKALAKLEIEAEERFGRGTAIELLKARGGVTCKVWSADGRSVVAVASGAASTQAIALMRVALKGAR